MVRSLKVIGTFALTLVAGASSLAVPRASPSQSSSATRTTATRSAVSVWGSSSTSTLDDVRRVPPSMAPFGTVAVRGHSHSVATMTTPAVLDRPSAGPAVLDRPPAVVEKEKRSADDPVKERKPVGNESWEVRIYNDGTNTREFVARCLVQLAGLSELAAYQTMMQAHQNGIAVVGRYVYERAEMYHEALKTNGIICDLVPVDEEN